MARRFRDAPNGQRCKARITLRDGSTADCGRQAKDNGLCTQHRQIAEKRALIPAKEDR